MSVLPQSVIGRLLELDSRNLHRWLPAYAKSKLLARGGSRFRGPRHLLFALCDHYEPLWKKPTKAIGDERVRAWQEGYPAMAKDFRDSTGRPPRHSFFFAAEEYEPVYLDRLTDLVERGFGEIELHLHHHDSTSSELAEDLGRYLPLLRTHGHLSGPDDDLKFAFIHGNWCLANSRPDGKHCGIDDELVVLWNRGCYADFTFPSAPDITQPALVNQIYWPVGDLSLRAAQEHGEAARVGRVFDDRILMMEGPLGIMWDKRKRRPRIENGALTGSDPPTAERVDAWVNEHITIEGRPEWVFVKVHTHGAIEQTAASLLGDGGRTLHRRLQQYNDGGAWTLHYVSAREMFNVAMAAMDGRSGNPSDFYDYRISRPPALL